MAKAPEPLMLLAESTTSAWKPLKYS